jgi:sugar lactone lactonase YvrE
VAQSTQVQSYQWQRDGVDIPGATTARYAVRASEALNGANFSVVVRSALGQASSRAARLTVKTQPGISVVAGQLGGSGFADGIGEQARLGGGPIAMGPGNKVYELSQYGLLAIAPGGVVTTLASFLEINFATDRYKSPFGIAIDPHGKAIMKACRPNFMAPNCVVSIEEWTAEGGVRSFETPCVGRDISLGTDRFGKVFLACNAAAYQIQPSGKAVAYAKLEVVKPDAVALFTVGDNGDVYFLDANAVRAVSPTGAQRLIAGQPGSKGVVDGLGAAARFSSVTHIQPGPDGGLYVIDDGQLRRISAGGDVKTWALDTTVLGASIDGMTVDATGNVYLDVAGTLRKIPPQSSATRLDQIPAMAGKQVESGAINGPAEHASFSTNGYGATFTRDRAGNTYIADSRNHVIRKVDAAGMVSTLAGKAGEPGTIDGTGDTARFDFRSIWSFDMTADRFGDIYALSSDDGQSTSVRKITSAGVVTTVVKVASPTQGSATDSKGKLYFVDRRAVIYKMDSTGLLTRFAQIPKSTENDYSGDLTIDSQDNVYASINTSGYGIEVHKFAQDGTKSLVLKDSSRPILSTFIAADTASDVHIAISHGQYWPCTTIEKIIGPESTAVVAGSCKTQGTKTVALPRSISDMRGLAVDADGALYTLSENALLKIVPGQ